MNQRLRILFSTESADPWILDAYKSFFDAFKNNHDVEIFCTTDGSKRDVDILPNYNIIDYSHLTKAGVPELVGRMIDHVDPKIIEKAAAACSWSKPDTIILKLLFFKIVVSFVKPDVVIVWNGMSDIRLVIREFLEEAGIPFVYAEKGMLPNSWYIDPSGINARCSLTSDCTEQKTAATDQKDLLEYVRSIVSTGASAWEQPKRHGRSEFLQSLNIPPHSKIIFFPGQVDKDSNIVCFSPLKSMVEAVKAIIDAMPAETVLLVKPHPKSSSESQAAVAGLAVTHPNVVIVKDINVWDIIEAADIVVSINSTVAFESLLQQKNVVLLGESILSKTGLVPQTPVSELKNTLSSFFDSNRGKKVNFERSLSLTDFLRQKYYMFKGEARLSPFAHSILSKYVRQSAAYPFTRNELFISFYRRLSVVLTTCNRPDMLRQVLDGFATQTAQRNEFEVIVVDDGSQPPVKELVESFSPKLDIQYIYQENKGLAAARNTGIKAVRGEIVLFHDDDNLPEANLVAEHIKSHRQHPEENIAVLGYLAWHPELKITPLMHYITGPGGQYFGYTKMHDGQSYDAWKWWGGLISAKMSMMKTVEGPFDEQFRFGYEDTELVCRLLNRDIKILYNSRAKSFIIHSMSFEDFCRRRIKQGHSLYHLARKHPQIVVERYHLADAAAEYQAHYQRNLEKWHSLIAKYESQLNADPAPYITGVDAMTPSLHKIWAQCFRGYLLRGYIEEATAVQSGTTMVAAPVATQQNAPQIETPSQAMDVLSQPPQNYSGKPLRITFVSNRLQGPDQGSSLVRVHNILKLLAAAGHSIDYLYFRKSDIKDKYANQFAGKINFTQLKLSAIDIMNHFNFAAQKPDCVWFTNLWTPKFLQVVDDVAQWLKQSHPQTHLIVDTMDFHYKKHMRKYEFSHNADDMRIADEFLAIERRLYPLADKVVTVSEEESRDIAKAVPDCDLYVIPNIHTVLEHTPPLSDARTSVLSARCASITMLML